MLKKDLLEKACRIAINNVLREGTTDVEIFKTPFEIEMLREKEFQEKLTVLIVGSIQKAADKKECISNLGVHKIGHVLVPKKSLSDYRKCALIEIYDEIIYLTLTISLAREIEKMRINKSEKKIFSYRYAPDEKNGNLFDKEYNYTTFKNKISKNIRLPKNKIIVECDISNFYDRLNIHRIESILRSSANIDKDIVYIINELLLFWAGRDSYGLPVGSNASRILAEASLIEVDNYLKSKQINFIRFVDDYRIFAENARDAHSHLALLVSCLNREGLFLNVQKTNIKAISINNKGSGDRHREESFSSENGKAHTDNFHNNTKKIIRGYSGLIPTKFRNLSASQKSELRKNNLDEMLSSANEKILIEPKEITELIKTIVAKDELDKLSLIPAFLEKFPQFIPYYINVCLKYGEKISSDSVKKIKSEFINWVEYADVPEYIQVYIVRLYSTKVFLDKSILLKTFRNLKRNSGDYIGRVLLESLEENLSRGELLEVREYFYRADNWEKRQIVKLLDSGLFHGEKRPFFKNISLHNNDIWIEHLIKQQTPAAPSA